MVEKRKTPFDAHVRANLRSFYFGDMSEDFFSEWLYCSKDLPNVIGEKEYLELISADYKAPDAVWHVRKLIERIYPDQISDMLFKERAIDILNDMLSDKISLEKGCDILASMEIAGHKFIPLVFDGYDGEFKDVTRHVNFDVLSAYEDRIKCDARELLRVLSDELSNDR